MPAIEVEVANTSAHQIDEQRLVAAVTRVLQGEGICSARISVAVVDDETIHRLNGEYLDHDYATDVLSFAFDPIGDQLNGELVLSADTALRVAPEFEWSAEDEMLLYAIHGTLHLVGYDDQSDSEQNEMRGKERDYLAIFDLKPRYEQTSGEELSRGT